MKFLRATVAALILICPVAGAEQEVAKPGQAPPGQPAAGKEDDPKPSLDGWFGPRTRFVLDQGSGLAPFVVRGQIPALGAPPFSPVVKISIDGVQIIKSKLAPGDFELRALAVGASGLKHVEVLFDQTCKLPAPDGREVSALLKFVGFERITSVPEAWKMALEPKADVVATGDGVGLGANWYPFESWHGLSFRWAGKSAELGITSPQPGILVADVEAGPGLSGKPGKLRLVDAEGRLVDSANLNRRTSVELAVGSEALLKQPLRLEVDGGGQPVPGDGRTLDVRVFSLAFHPQP